jgi:hypothetical protein
LLFVRKALILFGPHRQVNSNCTVELQKIDTVELEFFFFAKILPNMTVAELS